MNLLSFILDHHEETEDIRRHISPVSINPHGH